MLTALSFIVHAAPLEPGEMEAALETLQQTLHDVHPEPFAVVSERRQDKALAKARRAVREPLPAHTFLPIARSLVTPLHDAHTTLSWSGDDTFVDARFVWAHDGLALVEGPVTGRVDRLNGLDVDALQRRLDTVVSSENDHWVRRRGERLIAAASTWRGWGFDGPLAVELADGERLELPFSRSGARGRPSEPDTWWTVVPEAGLGWLRLASCPKPTWRWGREVDHLFHELQAQGLERLVIDVRGNGGGHSGVMSPILEHLAHDGLDQYGGFRRISDAAIAQRDLDPGDLDLVDGTDRTTPFTSRFTKGRSYRRLTPFDGEVLVLTDAGTFSSGNWVAVVLSDNDLATVVGEPTGNAPSSYGDLLRFPDVGGLEGLDLGVSYTRWLRPDRDRDPATTLVPDHVVPTGVDDHLAGHDPVWAWILDRAGAPDDLPIPAPPLGVAPQVVKLEPANGASDVPASTDTLVVHFSEPMQPGGRAIVGGGPSYPTMQDPSIRWRDPQTLEILVDLVPDHDYALGINSQRFQGFRAEDGTPSVPVWWTFTTAP